MVGDLLLFFTLLVNAGAILNFKLQPAKDGDFGEDVRTGFGDKIREMLLTMRKFRIFIAIWNLVIIILMFLMFGA